MPDAYVAGIGRIPFGRHPETRLEALAAPAVMDAVRDAEAAPAEIDAIFCGNVYGGSLPGQRLARELGLTGRPIVNVEAACSSSALAFSLAVQAVRDERYRAALVVGVEQLSVFGRGTLPLNEDDLEIGQGLTMPALYAMRAQRYLADTEATVHDLALVSEKNHANGARSPYAQFRQPTPVDEVLASRPIADPLTLLQCCGSGDGAAAALVAGRELAGRRGGRSVRVAGSAVDSGTVEPHDLAREPLTVRTAGAAYGEAGVGPGDLDLVELHDAFTIAELLYYEALGLCGDGEAAALLRSGATALGGRCPVNPGGGLLARGHPVGATGVAQVCEVADRLRDGGDPPPRVGLTHCTGGGIFGYDHAACSVHVLMAE